MTSAQSFRHFFLPESRRLLISQYWRQGSGYLNGSLRDNIYTKDGVPVKAEDGSNIYMAIVSVSVGVLQTDLIDFRPKLRVSMILEFFF
ncbi:hypothetical protein POTOM_043127 [Populus tomentosa]|uniref:Uncharacterized protein n=1 Tax=Populus tomentosa TaxID=118781 RepID=A0A8X7YGZ3_POPTO|nr:hypothetical protein POTOM_043127 [Populus tomentosa]